MNINEPLEFGTRKDWHNWLKKNHVTEKEAWLYIRKKDSGGPGIFYNQALEEALRFGWIDGKMKSIDDKKFVLRFSPRKKGSAWSKRNKEAAERLIASGQMENAGLDAIEEAKKSGAWDGAYTSLKQDTIPPDLEQALSKNKIAFANFFNFAVSYRNMYIGWVTGAKTDITRRRRIDEVVRLARLNKKLITD